MKFRVLALVTALLLGQLNSPAQAQPAESPKCNDLGYERLYGSSGGCLISFSDKAYVRSGIAFNPEIVTCSYGRDSIQFVYFPNVPKSGQLDGLGKVSFEFDYFNDCSLWPGGLAFEAFLTDVNGNKYSLGEVENTLKYRDCSAGSSCFPYVYGVNEARGRFDVSQLNVEGYYKFSIQIKRNLATATPSEKSLAGQEKNMLVEYSNQLWLGSPKRPTAQTSSPTVADCRASKSMNFMFGRTSPMTLKKAHQAKLRTFLRVAPSNCINGETVKIVECIGSYSNNKDKPKVQTRTKNSCGAVKKLYPKSRTVVSVKKNYSIDSWVEITAYFQR